REDRAVACAADQDGLAEQCLVHHPSRAQVGAYERDVPQPAHQFGFEILHWLVPGWPPGRYVGMMNKSVSPGLPPACVSMQCTWPRWCVWWLNICVTRSHFGLRSSRLIAPEE